MPIRWHQGRPPRALAKVGHLLLIAYPNHGLSDPAEDPRPGLYVGRFSEADKAYVPASIAGISQSEALPALEVLYWADINLPDGVEVQRVTDAATKS